jgi:creatinine deaminase
VTSSVGIIDARRLLDVALTEARIGLGEGGVPIGAALYAQDGSLLGQGRNRRVQHDDPSAHAETDAFRNAGRRSGYRDTIMVTTLAPCWYCSGLIRQFGIPTVVIGESTTFRGGIDWLAEHGVEIIDLESRECMATLASFIAAQPETWAEDIGR